MSSNSFCPKCKSIPIIDIDFDNVIIECEECKFECTTPINEYISLVKDIKPKGAQLMNETINKIQTQLSLAKHHVTEYFTRLKTIQINTLLEKINSVETAYQESYTKNNDILELLQLLIDNYNGSQTMLHNIMHNSNFDIHRCFKQFEYDEEKDQTEQSDIELSSINSGRVIDFFEEYHIINYDLKKAFSIKEVKKIRENSKIIFSLCLLKDNRLVSVCQNETIYIYDINNDYHLDMTITDFHATNLVCQLDDNRIIIATNSINICELSKTTYKCLFTSKERNSICKVVLLPDKLFAFCSFDPSICIMSSEIPYTDTILAELIGHTNPVLSLLYIQERNMLVSGNENSVRLWNLTTYQCEMAYSNICCCFINSLLFEDNLLIVGGKAKVQFIDIQKGKVQKILSSKYYYPYPHFYALKQLKKHFVITTGNDGNIFIINLKRNDIKEFSLNIYESSIITDIVVINENTLVTSEQNGTIRIFNYSLF